MGNLEAFLLAVVILTSILFEIGDGTSSARGLTDEDKKSFNKWKTEFNKTYLNSKAEKAATQIFTANFLNINAHNKRTNETYKRGTNAYSDLTLADVRKRRTGLKEPNDRNKSNVFPDQLTNNVTDQANVNFTDNFPSVKDQMHCSASWAFSTVSLIDYWMRRSQRNYSYSEQNLIDCDKNSSGCEGGWPTNALNYIRNEGISDGSKYPFNGVKHACRRTATKLQPILKIPNACEINLNGNETDLKKLISRHGPVVSTMAITDGFASYKRGVFHDPTCSNKVEHAITIVGYGTSNASGDFWIIRNSWGTTWGINGYALVARNRLNHCAIASYAMFPC